MGEAQRRSWLVRTVVVVVVAVALIVGAPWVYARFILREAPEPMELSLESPVLDQVPTGPLAIDGAWQVQAGSEAGYRLGETLSSQQVTVVGRTEEVTGTLVVDGGVLMEATITVDAGSISTDESARDAYFRRALDTSSFPEATFELNEEVDVSAIGESEAPLSVSVIGIVTLAGVSQPATATLDVQRTAEGIEVVGTVPVLLTDHELTVPDLGWVVVDPSGAIEVRLLLTR